MATSENFELVDGHDNQVIDGMTSITTIAHVSADNVLCTIAGNRVALTKHQQSSDGFPLCVYNISPLGQLKREIYIAIDTMTNLFPDFSGSTLTAGNSHPSPDTDIILPQGSGPNTWRYISMSKDGRSIAAHIYSSPNSRFDFIIKPDVGNWIFAASRVGGITEYLYSRPVSAESGSSNKFKIYCTVRKPTVNDIRMYKFTYDQGSPGVFTDDLIPVDIPNLSGYSAPNFTQFIPAYDNASSPNFNISSDGKYLISSCNLTGLTNDSPAYNNSTIRVRVFQNAMATYDDETWTQRGTDLRPTDNMGIVLGSPAESDFGYCSYISDDGNDIFFTSNSGSDHYVYHFKYDEGGSNDWVFQSKTNIGPNIETFADVVTTLGEADNNLDENFRLTDISELDVNSDQTAFMVHSGHNYNNSAAQLTINRKAFYYTKNSMGVWEPGANLINPELSGLETMNGIRPIAMKDFSNFVVPIKSDINSTKGIGVISRKKPKAISTDFGTFKENTTNILLTMVGGIGGRISSGSGDPTTTNPTTAGAIGEFYYDYTGNTMYEWNGVSWATITGDFTGTVSETGDHGKISSAAGAPTGSGSQLGSLYINTSNGNVWETPLAAWSTLHDTSSIFSADVTISGKISSGTSLPGSGTAIGEFFYDRSIANIMYEWNGTVWNPIYAVYTGGADYTGAGAPGTIPGATSGDIYYDTTNNITYEYNGASWDPLYADFMGEVRDTGTAGSISSGFAAVFGLNTGTREGSLYIKTDTGHVFECLLDAWANINVSVDILSAPPTSVIGNYPLGKDSIYDHYAPDLEITTPPAAGAVVAYTNDKSTITLSSGATNGMYSFEYRWKVDSIGYIGHTTLVNFTVDAQVACLDITGLETIDYVSSNILASAFPSVDKNDSLANRTLDIVQQCDNGATNFGAIGDPLVSVDVVSATSGTDVYNTADITPTPATGSLIYSGPSVVVSSDFDVGLYVVSYKLLHNDGGGGPCAASTETDTFTFHVEDSTFTAFTMPTAPTTIDKDVIDGTANSSIDFLTPYLGGRALTDITVAQTSTDSAELNINVTTRLLEYSGTSLTIGATYDINFTAVDKNDPAQTVQNGIIQVTIIDVYGDFVLTPVVYSDINKFIIGAPSTYDFLTGQDVGGRGTGDYSIAIDSILPANASLTYNGTSRELELTNTTELGTFVVSYTLTATEPATMTSPASSTVTFTILEPSVDGVFNSGGATSIGSNVNFDVTDNTVDADNIFVRDPRFSNAVVKDLLVQNYTGSKSTTIQTNLDDVVKQFIKYGNAVYLEQFGQTFSVSGAKTGLTTTFRI